MQSSFFLSVLLSSWLCYINSLFTHTFIDNIILGSHWFELWNRQPIFQGLPLEDSKMYNVLFQRTTEKVANIVQSYFNTSGWVVFINKTTTVNVDLQHYYCWWATQKLRTQTDIFILYVLIHLLFFVLFYLTYSVEQWAFIVKHKRSMWPNNSTLLVSTKCISKDIHCTTSLHSPELP